MSCARKLRLVVMAAMLPGVILFALPGLAAVTEEAPETITEEVAEEVPPEEVLETEEGPIVEITPTGLISFDFREAPIREVLRLFASQVKVNIVATPSVTGAVNMKLENVRWRKALELILDVNKLKMTEDEENNIIKVMTQAEVAAEPMTTTIYSLNYLQAADYELELDDQKKTVPGAATMLKPLLKETETIEADAASNKLIVHAIPETHETLASIIKDLDKQIRQVLIEVKFVEASTEAGKNLGIKWDFLREYGVEATDISRVYSKQILKGFDTAAGESDAGALSERLSSSGDTDLTSARSSRLFNSLTDGGLTWENSLDTTRDVTRNALSSFSRDVTRNLSQNLSWDRTRNDASDVLKTATLSADKVRLVLSALIENSDAKLVSNPRISTVDNKVATIKAVKQWPIPNWTYNADTGTWEVQGFDFKDIGITLKVTPHVNQDDFITLDVDPEVSAQVDTVTFGGGAGGTAEIPVINVRNANTRVIVKSGETLVIGGLVRSDEVLKKSGVPLLKDVPVVGELFKHTSKSIITLDLMVFITPIIVEGPAAAVLAPPPEYLEETPSGVAAKPTGE